MANDDFDRETKGILGDINPTPAAKDHMAGSSRGSDTEKNEEDTGAVTAGTEVGGTRNFRTGSGAVGSDIGNRPE